MMMPKLMIPTTPRPQLHPYKQHSLYSLDGQEGKKEKEN
jgi:hypothetical protein